MHDKRPHDRPLREGIDQISTRWPMIQDPVQFVMRYSSAIRGYLGVFLKNPHDVEDVCQAFLVRVLERGIVDQSNLRGRFRDYLIASVRNAALAHVRRRTPTPLENHHLTQASVDDSFEFAGDEEWIARWRQVVLAGVWTALEDHQAERAGSISHVVLRTLVDHPGEDSRALAARVSQQCGRTILPEAFRKQVSRSRRLFAELMVAEITRTLDDPTPAKIAEELIDLGLMKYVKPFLPLG